MGDVVNLGDIMQVFPKFSFVFGFILVIRHVMRGNHIP